MALAKVRKVRKITRDLIALAFWAHALYATHLIGIPAHVGLRAPRYAYSAFLLFTISFYSLLSEYEWFSIAADCLYIYLWPCIAIYRLAWLSIRLLYKYLRSQLVVPSVGLIIRPVKQVLTPAAKIADSKAEHGKRSIAAWIAKPFTEFSVLWSLVILSSEVRVLTLLACAVALSCAGRALYELWDFTADASTWIDKVKTALADRIATHIGQIRAWEELSQLEEVTKAANAVKMLEFIFVFIADNHRLLRRTTILFAGLVSVVFYCYISFVFSCLYVGLAKVQHIPWGWPDAFVNSLYIPIAYTNLPRNFPIMFVGGLHAVAVLLLGWNIFFRHLSSRFERIAVAASELRGSFEDKVLRVKLAMIQEQTSRLSPAVPGVLQTVAAKKEEEASGPSAALLTNTNRKGFRQVKKQRRRGR